MKRPKTSQYSFSGSCIADGNNMELTYRKKKKGEVPRQKMKYTKFTTPEVTINSTYQKFI
ncbi:hypothetical protein CAEBREN_02527 [Caenorhabditis brenneri]|uniref:Uncharacterized protein n=1 Tax=Caenorhabditis brenneri TaxID=135651 RepID=G0N2Y7_CAEBE|nr:hypothetical protein CAEBREN_02527 [Caenorhabditis brenneri]